MILLRAHAELYKFHQVQIIIIIIICAAHTQTHTLSVGFYSRTRTAHTTKYRGTHTRARSLILLNIFHFLYRYRNAIFNARSLNYVIRSIKSTICNKYYLQIGSITYVYMNIYVRSSRFQAKQLNGAHLSINVRNKKKKIISRYGSCDAKAKAKHT